MRNLKSKILTKSNAYLTDVFGFSVGELAKQKATGEFEGLLFLDIYIFIFLFIFLSPLSLYFSISIFLFVFDK